MIRISAPHFVAGVDPSTGQAAPIIAYMRTWSIPRIVRYCQQKGWQWERI